MRTVKMMRTLLAGETLNLTTDPEFSSISCSITKVYADGYNSKMSARGRTNKVDSNKRDRSTTGIFVSEDDAKALQIVGGITLGSFDIVYCPTGSDPIRCEITEDENA